MPWVTLRTASDVGVAPSPLEDQVKAGVSSLVPGYVCRTTGYPSPLLCDEMSTSGPEHRKILGIGKTKKATLRSAERILPDSW